MCDLNYSIIIPHHNIPELLLRCLNSIPKRDDIEIIVVDDNSDPKKVDFDHFPGIERSNLKIILSKEGKGAGYARNIGLHHAKGRWILFADADDTYTSEFNDVLSDVIDCSVDVVYFKCNIINSNGKSTMSLMNHYIDSYLSGKGDINDVKYGAWEPWNKIIKRELIITNNILFEEILSSNDKLFSLRVGECASKIKVIDIALYNYIIREGSIITSKSIAKFHSAFGSCIRQNILYKRVGYKRLVFFPYFLIRNRQYVDKRILKEYYDYLKTTRSNPLEGFFSNFIHLFLIKKLNK